MASIRFKAWASTCGALAVLAPLVSLAGAGAGCGSGSGPLVTSTPQGRDDPGTTRDTPPASDDVGANGDCLVCDVAYQCTNTQLGGISLSSSAGECTAADIAVVCSGVFFGASSCSGGGGGAFTCGQVVCTPVNVQQGGSGGGGGNGSSSGVLTPGTPVTAG
jgi:hypothetical protein